MPPASDRRRIGGDQIFAGLIALLFVGMVALASAYTPEARLLPLIIGSVGALLAGAVAIGFGRAGEAAGTAMPRTPRLLLAILAPPLYALSLWLLGHWITNLVAIPTVALLLGYRRLVVLVPVTLALTIALGLLFPLLHIRLPSGRFLAFLF